MFIKFLKIKIAQLRNRIYKKRVINGAISRICRNIRYMIVRGNLYCKVPLSVEEADYADTIISILQKHGFDAKKLCCLTLLVYKANNERRQQNA
jgi:hypothetical protein